MKKLVLIALIALCGCSEAVPTKCCAPKATQIEKRCNCWLNRSVVDTSGCPCQSDCDCKPKAKCGCDCRCGVPKK